MSCCIYFAIDITRYNLLFLQVTRDHRAGQVSMADQELRAGQENEVVTVCLVHRAGRVRKDTRETSVNLAAGVSMEYRAHLDVKDYLVYLYDHLLSLINYTVYCVDCDMLH